MVTVAKEYTFVTFKPSLKPKKDIYFSKIPSLATATLYITCLLILISLEKFNLHINFM